MTPKTLPILEQVIDVGISRGYYRAFKHQDNPNEDTIKRAIFEAVMDEFHEWFDLED